MAIATDISSEEERGKTMAMVGACFSIAFTFGLALGAALSNITTVAANPFATAAGVSLFLIVTETIYLYLALPETHPTSNTTANGHAKGAKPVSEVRERTNSHTLLNFTHFAFILVFGWGRRNVELAEHLVHVGGVGGAVVVKERQLGYYPRLVANALAQRMANFLGVLLDSS